MPLSDRTPSPSDADLIVRAREGDADAFAALHTRHRSTALGVARHMSRDVHDAEDLVSEAFLRVLAALRRGSGPTEAFRPYLLTTLRRVAYDRTDRRRPETPVDLEEELAGTVDTSDLLEMSAERQVVAQAFASLPERWQAVLWHTEVEGYKPIEAAPILGLAPNAVAALAYRAREGLRQAYLAAHIRAGGSRACQTTTRDLGAYVRGALGDRPSADVQGHLETCPRCQAAHLDLVEIDSSISSVVAAVVVGGAIAAEVLRGGGAGGSTGAATGASGGGSGAARAVARSAPHRATRVLGAAAAVVVVAALLLVPRGGGGDDEAAGSAPSGPATTSTVGASGLQGAPGATTTEAPTTPRPSTTTSTTAPRRPPGTTPDGTVPTGGDPASDPDPGGAPGADPSPPGGPDDPPTTLPPGSPPEPAVALAADVFPVGALMAARTGRVGVEVSNHGTLAAPSVVASVRDAGRRAATDLLGLAPGCTRTVGAIECRATDLAPGETATWFLPVAAASAASELALEVQPVAPGVAGGTGAAAQPVSLPIAPAGEGVTARFAAILHGDVRSTGNTVLSCPLPAVGCSSARAGQGTALDNNDWDMAPVDVDGDRSTATSSRARVTVPSGARVVFAGLYWSGTLRAGAHGAAPSRATDPASVLLAGPSAGYRRVRAAGADVAVSSDGWMYQSFADVTTAVGRSGTYTVGGVHTATGRNAAAGWGLVVVVEDPSSPERTVLVFDGQAESAPTHTPQLTIGGYRVRSGTRARVGVVAFDGDAGIGGDHVVLDGTDLGDARNPRGNLGNGTITRLGGDVADRAPADRCTFGVDVDDIDATGALRPGTTQARIRLESDRDITHVSAVTAVVDRG